MRSSKSCIMPVSFALVLMVSVAQVHAVETGWSGTIRYKKVVKLEGDTKSFPNAAWSQATATGHNSIKEELEADITLEAGKPSIAVIKARLDSKEEGSERGIVDCGRPMIKPDPRLIGSEMVKTGTGSLEMTGKASTEISVNKQGQFRIRFGVDTKPLGSVRYHTRWEYSGGCKEREPSEKSFTFEGWKPFFVSSGGETITGIVDPNNRTVLSGSKQEGNYQVSWTLTYTEEPIQVTAHLVHPEQKDKDFLPSDTVIAISAEASSTGGKFEEFEIESEQDAFPEIELNQGGDKPLLQVKGSGFWTGKTRVRALYAKKGVVYRSEPIDLEFCSVKYIVLTKDSRELHNSWAEYREVTPELLTAEPSLWFIHGNNLVEMFANREAKVILKEGGVIQGDYLIWRWVRGFMAGNEDARKGARWADDNIGDYLGHWVDQPGWTTSASPDQWPRRRDYYEFISGVKGQPACGYVYHRVVLDIAPDKYRVRMYEAEKISVKDLEQKMNQPLPETTAGKVIHDTGTRNSRGVLVP